MENGVKLSRKDVEPILLACYPDYNGRKITLRVWNNYPSELNSYWDGGSRDYYCFYHLPSRKVIPVNSNHPMFEADRPCHLEKLPPKMLIVKHSIFCGKDIGITIYANSEDMAGYLLPAPVSA